jgi:hypothetical protein
MNDVPNVPISTSPMTSPLQIWGKALTKPSEQTFAEIASSPNAKASTAYIWVFVASLIQIFLTALVQNRMLGSYLQQAGVDTGTLARGFGSTLIGAVCGAPIGAAVTTLLFALGVAVVQWIAKMFGGTGNTDRLSYAIASVWAPFALITGILSLFGAIPFVGLCVSAVLALAGIYIFVLEVMAVKAVNNISWGAAFGSVLIPGLVIGVLCACLIGGTFALLFPAIRNMAPPLPTLTP